MTPRQKIFALSIGIAIFFVILRLVYTRKLREEYSWLWLSTGCAIIGLVVYYDSLVFLTALIGAVLPTTTLFLCGMLFLVLLNLHFSIRISGLTDEVRRLAQTVAILEEKGASPQDQAEETPQEDH